MIYLDTHVLIWLYAGKLKRLSPLAHRHLDRGDRLLISPMVLLELEFLHELGKLRKPATLVFEYLNRTIGLKQCDHPFTAVIEQAKSHKWTREPFDRIIVAQASITHSPLLTADEIIHAHYKKAIW